MNSKERRKFIENKLLLNNDPLKGNTLAEELKVTRQVIVKDIAILRAEGKNIIATPEGYLVPKSQKNSIKKVIAVNHNRENIEDELQVIIKFGGIIEDVVIEHPIYGEIKGMLMLKTLFDVQRFMERLKSSSVEPLSALTGGVHLHTIEVESVEILNNIMKELKNKGYLVSD